MEYPEHERLIRKSHDLSLNMTHYNPTMKKEVSSYINRVHDLIIWTYKDNMRLVIHIN